ncbi:MAG: hypothetical protein VKL20_01755 [Synechocystis sp.]|nr:hypothetical protein [Synechocystis sp.]
MASTLPTFIKLAAALDVSEDRVLSPPYQGEPLCLKNFPKSTVSLPPDSQVFPSSPPAYQALCRQGVLDDSINYLNQALETLGLHHATHPPRLLLVLPDKTRSPIAARLLIDSVLAIKAQFPGLTFALLFGLGTHPPMTPQEIERHLETARYQTLLSHKIAIHQQTTRDPRLTPQTVLVPKSQEMRSTSFAALGRMLADYQAKMGQQQSVTQADSLERYLALQKIMMESHDALAHSVGMSGAVDTNVGVAESALNADHHALIVPRLLWEHHLTIVAGDTDLHPYEGRGGSGGLHKMLTIALADLGTIRLSHSTRILLDPQTRVGAGENAFVRILDYLADALSKAMLTEPGSWVCSRPLGFSILSLQKDDIHGFWWSQQESSRQQLTAVKQERQTQCVSPPLHLVITEAEVGKGTDILAGARSLQYLADWDVPDNTILMATPHQRVALLFNPCDEGQNHGGIGNHGTKQQLQVLQGLAREHHHQLRGELSTVTSLFQCLNILQHHRRETLSRWLHHLQLVSEIDDFLAVVGDLVKLIQTLESLGQSSVPLHDDLQAILSIYSSPYSEEGRAIAGLLSTLTRGESLATIEKNIENLCCHYRHTIGLGAGGQRALRLYRILQKFEALLLATPNETVLDFLAELDPDLCPFLPPAIANSFIKQNISCRLLGIVGINLNEHPCQTSVDYGMNYTKFYNPHVPQPQIGFLPKPLILRRR